MLTLRSMLEQQDPLPLALPTHSIHALRRKLSHGVTAMAVIHCGTVVGLLRAHDLWNADPHSIAADLVQRTAVVLSESSTIEQALHAMRQAQSELALVSYDAHAKVGLLHRDQLETMVKGASHACV